ncbi:hypothetical protein ERJ75_001218500 [Trypanosoma vivax]|nr:hypothetical protein ERJ75_001218500 [Trypanosoma vivax]
MSVLEASVVRDCPVAMQVKCVRRSALLLWLVLCSVVAAAHAAACTTNRLEYDGHAYVYDVCHGKKLDTACNVSHYVSMLTQFHKERKGVCLLLENAPEKAKRMRRRKRTGSLM